ncbi:hypothetical protein D9M69_355570 [compost metagenome]
MMYITPTFLWSTEQIHSVHRYFHFPYRVMAPSSAAPSTSTTASVPMMIGSW